MVELQAELDVYRRTLSTMLAQHNGEYVVIKDDRAVHFSPTYDAALEWAYTRFGLDHFFVKQVAEEGAVAHFSRDSGLCRP